MVARAPRNRWRVADAIAAFLAIALLVWLPLVLLTPSWTRGALAFLVGHPVWLLLVCLVAAALAIIDRRLERRPRAT